MNNSIGTLGSTDRQCTVCGRELKAIQVDIPGIGSRTVAPACKCETDRILAAEAERERKERVNRLQSFSDDKQMVHGASFGRCLSQKENMQAISYLRNLSEHPEEWGGRGIYIHGPNGVGKSYLLSAATMCLREKGKSVIYTTVRAMINRLKNVYAKQDTLDAFLAVDVLVIDEIGAEIPADWEMGDLFLILNGRQGRKPTLYGSNFTVRELEMQVEERHSGWGTRLMERIIATCTTVRIEDKSKRFEQHKQNKAWAEGRMERNV